MYSDLVKFVSIESLHRLLSNIIDFVRFRILCRKLQLQEIRHLS